MRYLLITLTFLLTFTGCQDKEHLDKEAQAKHDAQIAQNARAEVLAELKAKYLQEKENQEKKLSEAKLQKIETVTSEKATVTDEKNVKLNQMGIHMEKDSITIDTNKTKEFFNDLSKKLDLEMKKISDDLEKGIIETKEAGVEINDEHIHIDLNKTQNMLEDWGKKIQIFVQEFDDIAKNLDNNDSNKGK
jgi:hypothetical protein